MQDWGNARAAQFWEYSLPKDFKRPVNNDQEMEAFIRNKYERGRVRVSFASLTFRSINVVPRIPRLRAPEHDQHTLYPRKKWLLSRARKKRLGVRTRR